MRSMEKVNLEVKGGEREEYTRKLLPNESQIC